VLVHGLFTEVADQVHPERSALRISGFDDERVVDHVHAAGEVELADLVGRELERRCSERGRDFDALKSANTTREVQSPDSWRSKFNRSGTPSRTRIRFGEYPP